MLASEMYSASEQQDENSRISRRGGNSPMRNSSSKPTPQPQAHATPASPLSGSRGSRASNFYTVPTPQGNTALRPPTRSTSPWQTSAKASATNGAAQGAGFAWQSLGSNGSVPHSGSPEAECRALPRGGAPLDLSFVRHPPPRNNSVDLHAWLTAATTFEMNSDFDVSGAVGGSLLQLHDLTSILKTTSASKWTSQTLGDKLALHRILRNMRIPQMPVHFINEGAAVSRTDVESFVLAHLCGASSTPVAMKPTHLSNGAGVIFVGRVAPEDGPQPTINYLVHHLQKFLSQKAVAGESMQGSLKPGFIAQEKYDSVLGFDRPLELRLLMLWGKARLATWWWGHSPNPEEQPRNVWLARHLSHAGEFSSGDPWVILHGHNSGDPACNIAIELLLKQLPAMVAMAEAVATAVGAPFLRADFFVGSERWGVRLNDVVYGSAVDYFRNAEDAQLSDDANTIAQILQEGHAQCRRHFPPEHFLAKLGVHGRGYSDMSVIEVDAALASEDTPSVSAGANTKAEQSMLPGTINFGTQNFTMNAELVTPEIGASVQNQVDPPAPSSSSRGESKVTEYKLGDEAEIWSKSKKVWSRGKIIKVGSSTVTVSFTLPDGMLYAKELPPKHHDLRQPASQTPTENAPARNAWSTGDEIEVWSKSRQQWGQGTIEKVEARDVGDNVVLARFTMPDGSVCEKEMWANCAELRRSTLSNSAAPSSVAVAGQGSSSGASTWRKKNILSSETQPIDTGLIKAPSAVQRTPSYSGLPATAAAAPSSAQPSRVMNSMQSDASYAPTISSQQDSSHGLLAQSNGAQVPSTMPANGVQRSYSYVPTDAESAPPVAVQRAAPYLVPANDFAAITSNQVHVAAPNAAPANPTSAAPIQVHASASTPHAPLAAAAPVAHMNYVHVQPAPKRPASVPPQRAAAAPQNNTVMAPAWASHGQHCFVQQVNATPATMQVQQNGAGNVLKVEDIQIGHISPDPTNPALRSQLISRLGVGQNAVIKSMARAGGQNEGVWLLEDGGRNFVLKLVKNVNQNIGLPSETERFVKLAGEHPTMLSDPALTFPRKIFRLLGSHGNFDLLIMPRAPGDRVSDVISIAFAMKQKDKVNSIIERAGAFLKEFHIRYGNKQHCDFQASNVFYDEASGKFTMVDLADIGQQNLISEKDTERFIGGLGILGKSFGQQFFQDTQRAFQAGYNGIRS